MKYFVLIAALCTFVLCDTLKEYSQKVTAEIVNAGTECADKLGATPEDTVKLLNRKVPNNKAGLCMLSCLNKKFGIQNVDGAINKGSTIANIERVKDIDEDMYKKMSSVWKTCSTNTANDSDECNTGVNLMKCIWDEGDKLGLTRQVIGF